MNGQAAPRRTTRSAVDFLIAFVGLFILWIIFTGSLAAQELLAGAVVALAVAAMSAGIARSGGSGASIGRRITYAVAFIGYLAVAIVRANIDMALIVTRPKIAIRPGIVRVKTRLKGPLGRLILANAITLTPGTLSVDIDGDELFIHWVNVESEDINGATDRIVAGFEKYLEVICG